MTGTTARQAPPRRRLWSTRVLMVCAAFGAVQVLLFAAASTFTTSLAAIAPPLYALAAGLYSVVLFTARRLTGVAGTATITAVIGGILVSALSVIGPLAALPLVAAGLAFDLVLWLTTRTARRTGTRGGARTGADREWAAIAAAAAAGIALFAVSLPVFSAEHLTPAILVATLAGRVMGEVAAAVVAGLLARALRRAGVWR